MNSTDFSGPLSFPLVPSVGKIFQLFCEISLQLLDELAEKFVQILSDQKMYLSDFGDPLTFAGGEILLLLKLQYGIVIIL